MKIKRGDRIIIKDIPTNYPYRDLYGLQPNGDGQGTVENRFNVIEEEGIVSFFTCYAPYKGQNGHFEVSGCGHSVNLSNIKFIENAPAPFWHFKNGEVKAHNGETYLENVNWFECNFSDLIH